MRTDRNGKRIPTSYCSCGARPQGNGGHAAHRKMHQRKGDGHRPVTRDIYDACMADEALRRACDCGAGDQLGRNHRAQPPCPAYARMQKDTIDWSRIFQLRCRSRRGEALSADDLDLLRRALQDDAEQYAALDERVFNATVPFGSQARWAR